MPNRKTFLVKVNNMVRWEILAHSMVEALELAKQKHNYPKGPGIVISAQQKLRHSAQRGSNGKSSI